MRPSRKILRTCVIKFAGPVGVTVPRQTSRTKPKRSSAGNRRMLIGLAALTSTMLTGCAFSSDPNGELHQMLRSQAEEVDHQFIEILEQESSTDEVLTKLQRGHLGSTYTILDWGDEDFDSPTLSYPGAALYEAGIEQDVVVVRVAFTAGYSEGGIAPKETIGYACAEFSGQPGAKARESLNKENVACSAPMVEKSFDGEGYVALDMY